MGNIGLNALPWEHNFPAKPAHRYPDTGGFPGHLGLDSTRLNQENIQHLQIKLNQRMKGSTIYQSVPSWREWKMRLIFSFNRCFRMGSSRGSVKFSSQICIELAQSSLTEAHRYMLKCTKHRNCGGELGTLGLKKWKGSWGTETNSRQVYLI